jgi:O-phospho-L-seryl-tRNASec:L-selenocysteinyl-tRNA synthase
MDERNAQLAAKMVDGTYVSQGMQSLSQRAKLVRTLLGGRSLPAEGWGDDDIERFLLDMSAMDSNSFLGSVGLGEREGRVACSLVRRRHFGLSHGIGRSGDVAAIQPKAAGSSLVNKLASALALDASHEAGILRASKALVLPVATGLAVTLVLLALRSRRPRAEYVVWPRIDQQACFKAIVTAGLKPVVVELRPEDEASRAIAPDGTPRQLGCALEDIEATIASVPGGPSNVLCVLSTTSCFAPRRSDDIEGISELCLRLDVGHVVNNAYGLQASQLTHRINAAMRLGHSLFDGATDDEESASASSSTRPVSEAPVHRLDAVIQSTDKNFMVPVGGTVVLSQSKAAVDAIATSYPGRANASPLIDLLATLLSWGKPGWKRVRAERKAVHKHLLESLRAWAERRGERVISTPGNPISCAVTIGSLCRDPTMFGAMLFARGVSGCRVVAPGATKTIGPVKFVGWGSQCNDYPAPYFTAAAALGLTCEDVDKFIAKLDTVVREVSK